VVAAADEVTAVGFAPPEQTVGWARQHVAAGGRIDAVFALQEMAQVTVAETAQAVGAVGNAPEDVRCIRTKDVCRATLAAAGFPQPTVRLCADEAQAAAFLQESTGPWIVKPRDAMGSIGVSQIRSAADLATAIALLPEQGAFLVEEFVDGPEFSVEGIFLAGEPRILAITATGAPQCCSVTEPGPSSSARCPAAASSRPDCMDTATRTN
jgi:biotin carboxylase